ncbi:hypothetical protein D3C72_1727640 [compost metagenome]
MQAALLLLGQWHRRADLAHQFRTVAQKEIQQIEHDAETHQKFERTLAKTECLAGEELAALHRAFGNFVAHTLQIAHTHALKTILGVRREHGLEALNVTGDIQLAAFNVFV